MPSLARFADDSVLALGAACRSFALVVIAEPRADAGCGQGRSDGRCVSSPLVGGLFAPTLILGALGGSGGRRPSRAAARRVRRSLHARHGRLLGGVEGAGVGAAFIDCRVLAPALLRGDDAYTTPTLALLAGRGRGSACSSTSAFSSSVMPGTYRLALPSSQSLVR